MANLIITVTLLAFVLAAVCVRNESATRESIALIPEATPVLLAERPASATAPSPTSEAAALSHQGTTSYSRRHYGGVTSIQEIILSRDTIARVELLGMTAATDPYRYPDPSGQDPRSSGWLATLEFRFRVLEYLKGSGPNEIVAIISEGVYHATEAEARAVLPAMSASHDTRWDDREAMVFMFSGSDRLPSLQAEDRFQIGVWQISGEDAYSISSRHMKVWLPEAAPSNGDAGGAAGRTAERVFLLDAPGSLTGSAGRTTASESDTAPTITLTGLKNLINGLETEANAGGTDAYRYCVSLNYLIEREIRYRIERDGTVVLRHDYEIASGVPSDTVIHEERTGSGLLPDNYGRHWFEGKDKDLVKFEASDLEPFRLAEGEGPNDAFEFTRRVLTARPLPAGEYRYFFNKLDAWRLICDKFSELERNLSDHYLTVSAPAGTLHEAFFDPVTIGSAVGADGSNGVLKPAGFTFGGTTTLISGLKWESGVVTMTLSPSVSLPGHRAEFIGLDGSVVLTLLFDDAQAQGGTLTWTVADKPWGVGDLLMLRIEEILPEIFLGDLDSQVTQGESDSFTVRAAGLSSSSSYSIRLSTDNGHLGIGSGCSTVASTLPVPSGASYSSTLTLTGCIVATGTVTATLLEGTTPVATAAADVEVRASTNVTVTLSPREEERFTYTDIAVEWTDPGACIGDYFAAMYNSGGAVYKNLGSHPAPATTSVNAELGLRWDDISSYELTVRVDCSPSDGTGWRILGEVTLQSGLPSSP